MKTLPKLSNTKSGMSKRVSSAVKRLQNDICTIETKNRKLDSPKKLPSTNSNDTVSKKRKRNLK